MQTQKVISADSHIQEPWELYDRLPKQLRDRAPKIVERESAKYKVVDGKRPRRLDIAASRATAEDMDRDFRADPSGGRDILRRLKDQDRDGISAEVLYPNDTMHVFVSQDREYQGALIRSYNEWLMELVGGRPDRFVPVALTPVLDLKDCVAEIHRVAKMGYRTVGIPIVNKQRPYNLPEWEPVWAAIEETGLVLAFHIFTNSQDEYPDDWGEEEGIGGGLHHMAMSMADGQSPISLLISSGALERHPKLKFVVVECGAGWLAWLLQTLDEQAEKKHVWIRPKLQLKPSEYFARQGHVTFGEDPVGLNNLPFTGAGCLMWGSDYPHDEGTFPHSQEVIARTFEKVSPSDRAKILFENASKLYNVKL